MKVKIGTGVLGKDQKPFTPGTMYTVWHEGEGRWQSPIRFCWRAFAMAMQDPKVEEVIVIDHDNAQYTFLKNK